MFLDQNMNAKIGDFGSSVRMSNATQTVVGEINEFIGTVAYMAPEVITQQKKAGHGRKADIWSIACCVVEMATGDRPYGEKCDGSWMFIYQLGSGAIPRYVRQQSLTRIATHTLGRLTLLLSTGRARCSLIDVLSAIHQRDPTSRSCLKCHLLSPCLTGSGRHARAAARAQNNSTHCHRRHRQELIHRGWVRLAGNG